MRRSGLALVLTAALVLPSGASTLAADESVASPSSSPSIPPSVAEEVETPIAHVLDAPGDGSVGGWRELGRMPVRSGDGTELYFEGLAALGDRLVLMTVRYPIEGGRPMWTPWYSDDSVNWTESALPGEPQEMTDLASTTDGIVAVGVTGRRGERRSAVWITTDGIEWTPGSAPPIPMISRVVSTDPLTVLGSGVGLWAAADGDGWESLGKHPAASVEAGPGGLLAAGGGGQDLVTPTELWWSRDGRKWVQIRLPRVLREGHPAFGEVQVLSIGNKWVLVPKEKAPESIYLSKDGRRWRRVPRPPGMQGGSIYWMDRAGDRIQAFGYDGPGRPLLWTWEMGQPAPKPERLRGSAIGQPVRWSDGWIATGHVDDEPESQVLWRRG